MIGNIVESVMGQRFSDVSGILERYLPYLAAGHEMYFDKKEWAGRLAPSMNVELGKIELRGTKK